MIGFLLKKSFWNYWDRMGVMFLVNLGYLLLAVGGYFLIYLGAGSYGFFMASIAVVLLLFNLYNGMSFGVVYEMVENKSFYWKVFGTSFKKSWKASLILGAIEYALFYLFSVAFGFYQSMAGSMMALVAFFMLFWMVVFLCMASVWFYPLLFRFENPFFKLLKKCFLLAMDNGPLSLFVFLWGTIITILSGVSALIIPGPAALLVLWQNSLKLIMLKYDYQEENPGASKKIPWRALLMEEREKLGKRGISDFIRPGKL